MKFIIVTINNVKDGNTVKSITIGKRIRDDLVLNKGDELQVKYDDLKQNKIHLSKVISIIHLDNFSIYKLGTIELNVDNNNHASITGPLLTPSYSIKQEFNSDTGDTTYCWNIVNNTNLSTITYSLIKTAIIANVKQIINNRSWPELCSFTIIENSNDNYSNCTNVGIGKVECDDLYNCINHDLCKYLSAYCLGVVIATGKNGTKINSYIELDGIVIK